MGGANKKQKKKPSKIGKQIRNKIEQCKSEQKEKESIEFKWKMKWYMDIKK